MESPAAEIGQVIVDLLSTDTKKVETAVANYFIEDSTLVYPLFIVNGKDNLKKVYRSWSRFNSSFRDHKLTNTCFSKEGGRVYVDGSFTIQPWLYTATNIRYVLIFQLLAVKGVDGRPRYLIVEQETLIPMETFIKAALPFALGDLYDFYHRVRRLIIGLVVVYIVAPLLAIFAKIVGRN